MVSLQYTSLCIGKPNATVYNTSIALLVFEENTVLRDESKTAIETLQITCWTNIKCQIILTADHNVVERVLYVNRRE
jgi:hypothetical protein